jgi:rubrerythrin
VLNIAQVKELLLQSLEHEKGGVQVYQTALECVRNKDLKKEWTKYFEQTRNHVRVLTRTCTSLGLDPDEMTPGRQIVKHNGGGLVKAMKMALQAADGAGAELVACECVVLAETKDHFDWELIGLCAKAIGGDAKSVLKAATDAVEDEEDEHLYHTKGWCRELWLKALGLTSVLPPPEEKRDVKTAEGAAKVEKQRKKAVAA